MPSTLPPDVQRFIEEQIGSGKYASEAHVIAEGVRLLAERERRLGTLRREIQLGHDQIASGDSTDYDAESLTALLASLRAQGRRSVGGTEGATGG